MVIPRENRVTSFCGIKEMFQDHAFQPNFPDFDLKTLLSVSPNGDNILKYYKDNDCLNSTLRNKLVDIIGRHLYKYIMIQ